MKKGGKRSKRKRSRDASKEPPKNADGVPVVPTVGRTEKSEYTMDEEAQASKDGKTGASNDEYSVSDKKKKRVGKDNKLGSKDKMGSKDQITAKEKNDDKAKVPPKKKTPEKQRTKDKLQDEASVEESDDDTKKKREVKLKGLREGKDEDNATKWSEEVLDKGADKVYKEYRYFKMPTIPKEKYTVQQTHRAKCRYKEIVCYDKTRVPLQKGEDFIHANFVSMKVNRKYFICAQGPLEGTVAQFWQMIWEQNVKYVVMLCTEIESGVRKCHQYFGIKSGDKFQAGEFTITTTKVDDPKAEPSIGKTTLVTRRQLSIALKGETKTLTHLHWTNWRDKFVPDDFTGILWILKETRTGGGDATRNPVVVHCSAGIGRTGTLVFVQSLLIGMTERKVYMTSLELLEKLRKSRAGAVQTPLQYLFAHCAALTYLEQKKKISVKCKEKLKKFYEDYERIWLISQEAGTQRELGPTKRSARPHASTNQNQSPRTPSPGAGAGLAAMATAHQSVQQSQPLPMKPPAPLFAPPGPVPSAACVALKIDPLPKPVSTPARSPVKETPKAPTPLCKSPPKVPMKDLTVKAVAKAPSTTQVGTVKPAPIPPPHPPPGVL